MYGKLRECWLHSDESLTVIIVIYILTEFSHQFQLLNSCCLNHYRYQLSVLVWTSSEYVVAC